MNASILGGEYLERWAMRQALHPPAIGMTRGLGPAVLEAPEAVAAAVLASMP